MISQQFALSEAYVANPVTAKNSSELTKDTYELVTSPCIALCAQGHEDDTVSV